MCQGVHRKGLEFVMYEFGIIVTKHHHWLLPHMGNHTGKENSLYYPPWVK